jgi:hypothetical protein
MSANDVVRLEDFRQVLAEMLNLALSNAYGERMGFAVLIFRLGGPCTADYVSNVEKCDTIQVLRDTADRLEGGRYIPRTVGEA